MNTLLAKAKALWAWSWIVWGWQKLWSWTKASGNYLWQPPAHHIKYWVVVVLGISVAGTLFWNTILGAFDWFAVPFRQAIAPVAHVQSPPEMFVPGVVYPSQMPDNLADAPKPLPPLKPVVARPRDGGLPVAAKAPVKAYRAKKRPTSSYGATY